MDVIQSAVNQSAPEYLENKARMEGLLAALKTRLREVRLGGGAAAIQRHTSRGKLPARDRIERLLDPETPFLEIGTLAA